MQTINKFTCRSNRTAWAVLLGAALLASSCKKYTELSPYNSLAETSAFKTPNGIELVTLGVYEAAAIGNYQRDKASARGYPFGAASIEQAEMRGEDMLNIDQFYAVTYEAGYNTTSANNVNHWENLYALINQANVLIDGVRTAGEEGVIDQTTARAYEGEGRFLRALSHHELLIHFSRPYADGNGSKPGIPYRDKAIASPDDVDANLKVGRGTVAEAYAKLLLDLDSAEAQLPVSFTDKRGALSRATKGAAIALKTRIKLHKGDWAGVIAEGKKLGTDAAAGPFASPIGGYRLTAKPEDPFVNYKSNTESMFSIANSAVSNGGTNGALPSMFGPADQGARGLVATSPILYNAAFWVDGDLRRTNLQVLQQASLATYYFNYKYRDYVNKGDWAPIIRYAEVLLNTAEAYARQGNVAQAFLLLNAVRNRSVPTAAQFIVPPADLVQAILNERRIEFTGEGRRWPDIHRLALDPKYNTKGIPEKLRKGQMKRDGSDYNYMNPPTFPAAGAVAAIPYTDYRFLWPIPESETAANPTLKAEQNDGYK